MKAVKSMITAAFLASVPATTAFAAPPPEDRPGANAAIFAYCTASSQTIRTCRLGVCMSFNQTQGTYGFVPQHLP